MRVTHFIAFKSDYTASASEVAVRESFAATVTSIKRKQQYYASGDGGGGAQRCVLHVNCRYENMNSERERKQIVHT